MPALTIAILFILLAIWILPAAAGTLLALLVTLGLALLMLWLLSLVLQLLT
jgi:hypothetical protein